MNSAAQDTPNNTGYRIMCFGSLQSFSHLAAIKAYPEILGYLTKENNRQIRENEVPIIPEEERRIITSALDLSSHTFAVVPISNSKLGDVYDFMPFYNFQMIAKVSLDVQFYLCSQEGIPEKLTKVETKNKAYEQVKEELAKILPGMDVDANSYSTARAAERASKDPTLGAICSPAACEKYGLKLIADLGTYVTKFGVFRNEPQIIHARADIQSKMSVLLRGGKLYTGRVPAGGQQDFALSLSNVTRPLRVKWGIDPIRDSMHLGHFSNLLKLADFKSQGHHILIVLGTFTGKIGDPSGNLEQRERLEHIELQKNADKIRRQITAILGDGIEFIENHTLVETFTIEELLKWGYIIPVQLMYDRQDFNQRRESSRALYLSEFLYGLFQTHDSIQLKIDIEIGGIDQIHNCALARDIMDLEGINPEYALLLPLLPGIDGADKMSSFKKNDIRLSEPRHEIRRKLLAIEDPENVLDYLRLLTRLPEQQIADWAEGLHNGSIALGDVSKTMVDAVLDSIPETLENM